MRSSTLGQTLGRADMLPSLWRSQPASAPDPQPAETSAISLVVPDPRADSSFIGSEDPFASAAVEAALGAATVKEGAKELPSAGLRVSWCCMSVPAVPTDGDKTESQDTVLVEPDFAALDGSRAVLLGVLDGHGESGGRVAAYVRDSLPTQLISVSDTASLSEAFLRTDEMLNSSGVPSLGRSGASACVLSLCDADGSCRVATVGDARALLGRREGGAGPLSAEQLCAAHTLQLKAEYDRCAEAGARIMSRRQLDKKTPWVGSWEGDVAGLGARPGDDDRPRIYSRDADAPGTPLSRAFGDRQAKGIGVIAEPETCRLELSAPHRYLVAATAGVFDCLSNDEALAIVSAAVDAPGGTPRAGCLALAAEAARQAVRRDADGAPPVSVAVLQLVWDKETGAPVGGTGAVGVLALEVASEPDASVAASDMSFSWMGDYDAFSAMSSPRATAPPSRLQSPPGSANASAPGTSPVSPKLSPAPLQLPSRDGIGDAVRADTMQATTRLPLTLTSTRRAPYVPPAGVGPPAGIAGRPASPLKGARERAHEGVAGCHAAAAGDRPSDPSPARSSFRRSRTATPPPRASAATEPKPARESKRLALPAALALPWQKRASPSGLASGNDATLVLPLSLQSLTRSNSRESESNSARLNPDLPSANSPSRHPLSPILDSSPACITPRFAAHTTEDDAATDAAQNSCAAHAQNGSAAHAQNSCAAYARNGDRPTESPAAGRARPARPTPLSAQPSDGEDEARASLRPAAPDSLRLGCFLKRCGLLRKAWKTRWAAIDAGQLLYYSDAACTACRGALPLATASIEPETFDAGTAPRGFGACHGFRITAGGKTIRGFPHLGLGAQTGDVGLDARLWLGKLRAAAEAAVGDAAGGAADTAGGAADTAGGSAEAAGAADTAGGSAETAGEDRGSLGTGCSLGDACGIGGCRVAPEAADGVELAVHGQAGGQAGAVGMQDDMHGVESLPPDAPAAAHPLLDAGGQGSGPAAAAALALGVGAPARDTAGGASGGHSGAGDTAGGDTARAADSGVAALREWLAASRAVEAELRQQLDQARAALIERDEVWRAQVTSLSERIDAGRRVEAELRAQLRDAHDDVARARLASPRSRSLSPRGSIPNLHQNRSSHWGNSGRVALVKNAFETGTRVKTPRGDLR